VFVTPLSSPPGDELWNGYFAFAFASAISFQGTDFKSDPSKFLNVTFVTVNQLDDGVMVSTNAFGDGISVSDKVEFLDFN